MNRKVLYLESYALWVAVSQRWCSGSFWYRKKNTFINFTGAACYSVSKAFSLPWQAAVAKV